MKKNLILLFFLLGISCCLFAQKSIYAGIGPEINAYTRDGFALGGNLLAGLDINHPFSIGLKAGFFNDLDTVSVLDTQGFFRYYLPFLKGLFAQAEAGLMLALEGGDLYPSFAGGLCAGYRLSLKHNSHIEFSARGGYPYLFGVGIMAGITFPLKGKNNQTGANL